MVTFQVGPLELTNSLADPRSTKERRVPIEQVARHANLRDITPRVRCWEEEAQQRRTYADRGTVIECHCTQPWGGDGLHQVVTPCCAAKMRQIHSGDIVRCRECSWYWTPLVFNGATVWASLGHGKAKTRKFTRTATGERIGVNQYSALCALAERNGGAWYPGCGWAWDNAASTRRLLDGCVRLGLAEQAEWPSRRGKPVQGYRINERGKAAVER